MRMLTVVFLAASLFTSASSLQAQTVKEYFVKNDKVPQGTMGITPTVGNYADSSGSGIEFGAKFSFEPFPKGFVQPINDSVSFEGGIFQGMSKNYTRRLLSASMRWDFNLIPAWTVFGAPGIAMRTHSHKDGYSDNDADIALSVGGLYNIKPMQALRFEADMAESTLRAGYMFRF